MYIVDTNILLQRPQIVEDKSKKVMIITSILKELDGLKRNTNPEVAMWARRAAIYISRNLENLQFSDECENWTIPVDDQLIKFAKKTGGILVTNDVYLKVRATIEGVKTQGYSLKDDYCGAIYYTVEVDDNLYSKELEEIIEKKQPPGEMFENQYLFVESHNGFKMGTFVYRGGELVQVKNRSIVNKYIDSIFPRNREQEALFDILSNKDITIVYAGGVYGGGKSMILNNFALQELEKGRIKRIVYVPNNSYTENSMEVGTLPGEIFDKTIGQIGPLIDLVGIDRVQDMLNKEELEIVPMAFIRGRSFENSIIIVNESQNLTEDHIKLLIARCGAGTRIFFDGDIKQADSHLFRNKNGLKLLLNLRKSEEYAPLFATIKLVTTERSKTACASDYLDSI